MIPMRGCTSRELDKNMFWFIDQSTVHEMERQTDSSWVDKTSFEKTFLCSLKQLTLFNLCYQENNIRDNRVGISLLIINLINDGLTMQHL